MEELNTAKRLFFKVSDQNRNQNHTFVGHCDRVWIWLGSDSVHTHLRYHIFFPLPIFFLQNEKQYLYGNDFIKAGRTFPLLHGNINWHSNSRARTNDIEILKKIVVPKLYIKFKFRLYNYISFDETFKTRPHLNMFWQYFRRHINCFMYNKKIPK